MNKLSVINGEAPETDSEDECTNTKKQLVNITKSIKGTAVHGEDSESEDDASVASIASITNKSNTVFGNYGNKKKLPEYNTLLHQKLKETNLAFQTNVNELCTSTVKNASINLNDTEQNLLQSQITLQSAVNSLRNLTANSTALKHKLEYVLTSKFISNIKTPK